MYSLKHLIIGAFSFSSLVAIATPSHAISINLFNTGFGSATTTGNATIQGAYSNGPTEGTGQALITTSGATTLAQGPLEAFVGITAGALDAGFAFGASDGSAIKQSFSAAAGATISFNWNFLTNEGLNNDYGFIVLDGTLTTLANVGNATTASSPFALQTTFQTFTSSPLTAGTHTVSFGVVNIDDTTIASGLLVDNLTVTAVPFEFSPTTGILTLAALFGCDRLRRKFLSKKN